MSNRHYARMAMMISSIIGSSAWRGSGEMEKVKSDIEIFEEIEPEYKLIQEKKSKLPRSKRDYIVRSYNALEKKLG